MTKGKITIGEGFRINFKIFLVVIIVLIIIDTISDYFFQYILLNPNIPSIDYFNWLFIGFFNRGIFTGITYFLFYYSTEKVQE